MFEKHYNNHYNSEEVALPLLTPAGCCGLLDDSSTLLSDDRGLIKEPIDALDLELVVMVMTLFPSNHELV